MSEIEASLIQKAFLFALKVHDGQKRKDGQPYIVHPVDVAMELARNGADTALICAGFLHDTLEDANVTEEQLRSEFPTEVTSLVILDSEDKTKTWEERKSTAIHDLTVIDNRNYRMLMCADKLVNLRNLHELLEKYGDKTWDMFFKRGRDSQAWLFHDTVNALESLSGLPMYEELKSLTVKIFGERNG